jgi:hypothetical protein
MLALELALAVSFLSIALKCIFPFRYSFVVPAQRCGRSIGPFLPLLVQRRFAKAERE